MNKKDYIAGIELELSDRTTYISFKDNHTEKFNEIILQQAHLNKLSFETISFLEVPKNPSTPEIYVLPKIHKNVSPPPGRPIVSVCRSLTERISACVHSFLQPFVNNLPPHIQDSNDFLTKL